MYLPTWNSIGKPINPWNYVICLLNHLHHLHNHYMNLHHYTTITYTTIYSTIQLVNCLLNHIHTTQTHLMHKPTTCCPVQTIGKFKHFIQGIQFIGFNSIQGSNTILGRQIKWQHLHWQAIQTFQFLKLNWQHLQFQQVLLKFKFNVVSTGSMSNSYLKSHNIKHLESIFRGTTGKFKSWWSLPLMH